MPLLLREAHHLVFDRRAVARAGGVDLAGVHRRAMEIGADQLVRDLAGVGQMAEHLRQRERVGEDRERTRLGVARRFLELREIDGGAIDARRRSGLEAAEFQAEVAQRIGERLRRRLAEAAADGLHFAGVHQGAKERSGGDDDGARVEARSVLEHDAADRLAVVNERRRGAFDDGDVRLSRRECRWTAAA